MLYSSYWISDAENGFGLKAGTPGTPDTAGMFKRTVSIRVTPADV